MGAGATTLEDNDNISENVSSLSEVTIDESSNNSSNSIKSRSFLDLSVILQSSETLNIFIEHMNKEYNVENLNFWNEINILKRNANNLLSYKKFQELIFDRFLKEDSLEQVNIPYEMKQNLINEINNIKIKFNKDEYNDDIECIPIELLDDIHQEVYNLMYRDSFFRFKKSNKWNEVLDIVEKLWEDSNLHVIDEDFLYRIYQNMKTSDNLIISDQTYHLRVYHNVMIGYDIINWLISEGYAENEREAILCGNQLIDSGYITHTHGEHFLENGYFFYNLNEDIPSPEERRKAKNYSLINLGLILNDPDIYNIIYEYTEKIDGKNFLRFYKMIEDLKRVYTEGAPREICIGIFQRFFFDESPEKINGPRNLILQLENNLELGFSIVNLNIFDTLQNYLLDAYEKNCWKLLKTSEHWDNILNILEQKSNESDSVIDKLNSGLTTPTSLGSSNNDKIPHLLYKLYSNVNVKDRRYHMRLYRDVFVGKDACELLIKYGFAENEREAVLIGNHLLKLGMIEHATLDHPFKNQYLFYRFTPNSKEIIDSYNYNDTAPLTNRSINNEEIQKAFAKLDEEKSENNVINLSELSNLDELETK